MSCTKKGYRSVFGDPQRTSLVYIQNIEKRLNRKYTVLMPDAVDGLHALSFARKGNKVDCFETNLSYINGGEVGGLFSIGIKAKINYENLSQLVKIYSKNFYNEKVINKYDFVYSYRSLHLDKNKTVPMDKKMRKLLSAVKENGYIYIFYHLAKDETDFVNYPKEQYFRLGEMKRYFQKDNWEVITLIENTKDTVHGPHPYNNKKHTHRVGYVFAHKKNTRLKYHLHYEITIHNNYSI